MKPTIHGHAKRGKKTPTFRSWLAMHSRCRYPSQAAWKNYGGRGITVCERWRDFRNFLADMGVKPANRSLDRIDNDGNYTPENCRWATVKQQLANRRAYFSAGRE